MSYGETLTELAKFGISVGFFSWIAKSLWGQFLARDIAAFKAKLEAEHSREIERLKADIRAAAFEHETRFARLHEDRVRMIEELYKKLARTHAAFTAWMAPLSVGNETQEEKAKKATTAANDLFEFFDENQIYVDERLCGVMLKMRDSFRKAWANFGAGSKMPDPKEWIETWEMLGRDIPPLRSEIERQIRSILGVQHTPA